MSSCRFDVSDTCPLCAYECGKMFVTEPKRYSIILRNSFAPYYCRAEKNKCQSGKEITCVTQLPTKFLGPVVACLPVPTRMLRLVSISHLSGVHPSI